MNTRIASALSVALVLAVSLLPANASPKVISWVEVVGDRAIYSHLVLNPPDNLDLLGVKLPAGAHFSRFYTGCEWRFELSRYDSARVKNLVPLEPDEMWAYNYRTSTGEMPESYMMAYETSSCFTPGTGLYVMIAGPEVIYGTTLVPTLPQEIVPEPTSVASLSIGLIVAAFKRQRNLTARPHRVAELIYFFASYQV